MYTISLSHNIKWTASVRAKLIFKFSIEKIQNKIIPGSSKLLCYRQITKMFLSRDTVPLVHNTQHVIYMELVLVGRYVGQCDYYTYFIAELVNRCKKKKKNQGYDFILMDPDSRLLKTIVVSLHLRNYKEVKLFC